MARFTARPLDPFADVPVPREERVPSTPAQTSPAVVAGLAARSAPNPRDQSLSSLAQDWWRRLAPELQPHELCLRYPRVANRLALCWNDADLTEQLFTNLMLDRRGGRKGFPKVVLNELLKLRELVTYRLQSRPKAKVGLAA